jgi:5-formyltetrahydrofolate cyclo-ligase
VILKTIQLPLKKALRLSSMTSAKLIRDKIWLRLHEVAKPDSRYHMFFSEVIPDFKDSEKAIDRIVALPAFTSSKLAFITPDNCLVDLRRRLIEAGTPFVMSTYGIYRGFLYMAKGMVPKGAELYAAWLDGMEHFARPISLEEINRLGEIDIMVTGASAVSMDGVRVGKGHGFFDLEWGMFSDLELVNEKTPVITVVHDVQLVEDKLQPGATDIAVDFIATPTKLIEVQRRTKRPHGIKWELLDPIQIELTPPIQELQRMRGLVQPDS